MISIFYAREEEALKDLVDLYILKSTRKRVKLTDYSYDYDNYYQLQGGLLVLEMNDPLLDPRYPRSTDSIFFSRIAKISRHLDLEIVIPILASEDAYIEEVVPSRLERLAGHTFTQLEDRHRETWTFLLKNIRTGNRIIIEIKRSQTDERVYRSIKQTRLHS